ncbi:MAG: hypothetical protein HQL94_01445 [Magnetococcales bacterium]|nr:hypothetical protein [Magnetococcales bacterium]MBF0439044.1 hypothetical protein [Magnetococcales bacterium]
MIQDHHLEVEILEVTDRIEEKQVPPDVPCDTVPIEDLVTVLVTAMTNLVAFVVHTGQEVAKDVVVAIRTFSHR